MKHIAAGQLTQKVTFQKRSISDDGYDTETWSDDFTKWAKITTKKSSESEQSGQLLGEATHVIQCRYSPKITATHRVSHKGKTYRIIGEPMNLDFANVVTEIMVTEITDA